MVEVERLLQRIKREYPSPAIKDILLQPHEAKPKEPLLKKQADFEEMFKQALEEINSEYISGTFSYIKASHPDLWQRLIKAENKLSEAWLGGIDDEFKKNLDEWIGLNHKAIEIFRERGVQRTLI